METEVQINGYDHVKCALIKKYEAVPKLWKEQILFPKEQGQDSQRMWSFYLLSRRVSAFKTYWEENKCTHSYNAKLHWKLPLEI